MSERKVLNKYYPPDFDPAKIPRLHLPKDRQYTVRLMAPCNMKCKTCGEYIYKGKKFNARKETVQGEEYLGLKIFRFYIKCTRCLAEITFKTDPQNADYVVEHGATRNFQALKLAEEQAEREQAEREEEEAGNPMKLLESRTKASKREMDVIEGLEELRDLQERHANVDYEKMLTQYAIYEEQMRKKQEDEDEAFVRSVFGKNEEDVVIKRILDDDSDEEPGEKLSSTVRSFEKPSDILTEESDVKHVNKKSKSSSEKNPTSSKSFLAGLVRPKPAKSSLEISTEHTVKVTGECSSKSSGNLSLDARVQSCAPRTTGLGLIGCYSDDSDESE